MFRGIGYANVMVDAGVGNFGEVIDSFRGNSLGKVVIINDLHMNLEVQNNIYNILKDIKAENKDNFRELYIEGLEGGEAEVDILKVIDKKDRGEFIEEFMKKGLVSGAERFKLDNEDIKLLGAEDKEIYINNFKNFYKSFYYIKGLEGLFNKLKEGYDRVRKYFLVDRIDKFYSNKDELDRGDIIKYLRYLRMDGSERGRDRFYSL